MTPLPYRPHPLLRNGHLQTLMVAMVRGDCPPHRARPLRIHLDPHESLIVHEELGAPISQAAPLAILLHGLGGCHRSPYLRRLAPRLRAVGFKVWRPDLRGCGAGLSHAWRPANAGSSDDLAVVVQAACESHPLSRICLVGFSLSGNILLKMLGEAAVGASPLAVDLTRVAAAVAVAPPINLHHCADNMDRWSRRIYTHYYLKMLAEQVQQKRELWPQWQQIDVKPPVRTIRQFDARYTAPLSGFVDADEYYTRSSAAPWLKHITAPTMLLVDEHDPIVSAHSFDQAELNHRSTEVELTRFGGHMGYFGIDQRRRTVRWLEYCIVEHLKSTCLR